MSVARLATHWLPAIQQCTNPTTTTSSSSISYVKQSWPYIPIFICGTKYDAFDPGKLLLS